MNLSDVRGQHPDPGLTLNNSTEEVPTHSFDDGLSADLRITPVWVQINLLNPSSDLWTGSGMRYETASRPTL
jgi:hypothetical protein